MRFPLIVEQASDPGPAPARTAFDLCEELAEGNSGRAWARGPLASLEREVDCWRVTLRSLYPTAATVWKVKPDQAYWISAGASAIHFEHLLQTLQAARQEVNAASSSKPAEPTLFELAQQLLDGGSHHALSDAAVVLEPVAGAEGLYVYVLTGCPAELMEWTLFPHRTLRNVSGFMSNDDLRRALITCDELRHVRQQMRDALDDLQRVVATAPDTHISVERIRSVVNR